MNHFFRALGFGVCICEFVVACAAVAALGGAWKPRLDLLTHLAPIYLLVGICGLLVAAGVPIAGRTLALGSAAVAIVASGVLMAPELAGAIAATKPRTPPLHAFKLIQFNAWGGNRKADQAAAWLLAQDPDVLVLQEGGRIVAELVRQGHYHLNCGNCYAAILSKSEPIWTNTPANWRIAPPPISIATFADPDGEIVVMGVHRHWPNRPALYQAEMAELKALTARYAKDRLIVAGDFNSTPWSFARRTEDRDLGLIRRTRALFTWPAERVSHNRLPAVVPFLPIDQVYAGPRWATVSVTRGPRLGSDHYPVVVTLAPIPSPEGRRP